MIVTEKPSRFRQVAPWVSLVARLILGLGLLVAGARKIFDLGQSVIAVQAYEFPIPDWLETTIGYGLPVFEIVLGLAIVAGLMTRWTGLIGGLSMLAYIAGIASAWARGLDIDCGCFTPGGAILTGNAIQGYIEDIIRDIGFTIAAAWLVVFPASRFSLDTWLRLSEPLDPDDSDDTGDPGKSGNPEAPKGA